MNIIKQQYNNEYLLLYIQLLQAYIEHFVHTNDENFIDFEDFASNNERFVFLKEIIESDTDDE